MEASAEAESRERLSWIVGTAIAILVFAAGSVRADFHAVIVGVADYPPAGPGGSDLSYTDDDAISMRESLLAYGNWEEANITLLLDASATKSAVEAAVSSVAAALEPSDTFLFYFAGHGTNNPDVAPLDEDDGLDEYLCAFSTDLSGYIRDDELADWLGDVPSDHILVILDTCYSGGQIRGARSINIGAESAPGDGFVEDLLPHAPDVMQTMDIDDLSESIVALAACGDDELSGEYGPPISHGIFTYFLLEAMSGGADDEGNLNGHISAEECHDYLYPRVIAVAPAQHPQMHDDHPGELNFLSSGSDVMLVLDRSGSMDRAITRLDQSKAAAKYTVSSAEAGDQIGVASYASTGTLEASLTPIETNDAADPAKAALRAAIASITPGGTTNFGAGLQIAYDQLASSTSPNPRCAILMSDGKHNAGSYSTQVEAFKSAGWPVYTVAFGADADTGRLQAIATETGGSALKASGFDLTQIYNRIMADLKGDSVLSYLRGWVGPGQVLVRPAAPLASEAGSVRLALAWSDGDLDLNLITPDGVTITPDDAAWSSTMDYYKESNYLFYVIASPEVGDWSFEIHGAAVSPSQAEYAASMTVDAVVAANFQPFEAQYALGGVVDIGLALEDAGGPILGAAVDAVVRKPGGSEASLVLLDDGLHNDGAAADGWYGGEFAATDQNGLYEIHVETSGSCACSLVHTIVVGENLPTQGITVQVLNQLGSPAVDARVEAYLDTTGAYDWNGSTDTGGQAWIDVLDGTYTLVASSQDDCFVVVEEGVTVPSQVTIDTAGTVSVTVEASRGPALGPIEGACVYAPPYVRALARVGYTDASGQLVFNATPMIYSLVMHTVWHDAEPVRYYLVKQDVSLIAPTTVSFDAVTMPTGAVTFELTGFPDAWFGAWGSHSSWSPVDWVHNGDTVIFSADAWSVRSDLHKVSATDDWWYQNYTQLEIAGDAAIVLQLGGTLAAETTPSQGNLSPGDTVTLFNTLTDQYGNTISRLWKETLDTSSSRALSERDSVQRVEIPMVTRSYQNIYPTVTVRRPDGVPILSESSWGVWDDYTFALASDSPLGTYSVSLTVETGPHQGLISGASTFTVGGGAAVFRVASPSGTVCADGTVHGQSFQVGAADIAEWVPVSEPVEPGDVLEFDPMAVGQYRIAQAACSTLIAGVVSTAPGVTLGGAHAVSEQALLALSGIVPVKTTSEAGPIRLGDLLVASSTPGCAMRWPGLDPCPCALVGKALEPMLGESGIILVLLTAH